MIFSRGPRILIALIILVLSVAAVSCPAAPTPISVTGRLVDGTTGRPIAAVTVQVVGTGRTTVTNDDGEYRLWLEPGTHELKYSHVAYYSHQAIVTLADTPLELNQALRPSLIEIRGIRVYEKAYDPAQQIIIEAIARKKQMLAKLHDYSFDAYTRAVVRDREKPDATSIYLIAESQATGYWERPNKYKQTIVARRQSANIPADAILMLLGDQLGFYQNRDEIGSQELVTVLADDALDHYNFYLLDTIVVDSQRVFVLEIEPKNQLDPLYAGRIQIADSSYGVRMVELTWNKGVRLAGLSDVAIHYDFACFSDEYWMPVQVRVDMRYKMAVPIPGFPDDLGLQFVSSLHSYQLQEGIPDGTFGEIAYEIAPDADKIDSATWNLRQTVPLTDAERLGYRRIDSTENAKPLLKKALPMLLVLPLFVSTQHDLFHFNRAEGAYLGLGGTLRDVLPGMDLRLKGGKALDADYWQYAVGISQTIWQRQKVMVGGEIHDEMQHRPTLTHGRDGNMTLSALLAGSDPFDYHRDRGFSLFGSTKLLDKTRLGLRYQDSRQRTDTINSDFSVFEPEEPIRENLPIADGRLRSLSAWFSYDSRPVLLRKRHEEKLEALQYSTVNLGVEQSTPSVLKSEFDFTRLWASAHRRQRMAGLGTSSVSVYWGAARRAMPPQRYFTIDYPDWALYSSISFQTLGEKNFSGNRVLAISAQHEFGRTLFAKSRLPLVSKIPFTFDVHGGAFWTDLHDHAAQPGDSRIRLARSAYSELGFGLGNLTPFLAPFNLALSFTWQLSAYDTNRFALSWGIGF